MRLTKQKLTVINIGSLAALAPVMIQLSNHLPAKYLWLAPLLVQAGNWLLAHKALAAPSPNLISRKLLRTVIDMAHERDVDVDAIAREISGGRDADQLTPREGNWLFEKLKATRRRSAATPITRGVDDPDKTPADRST
jgi:hypothetical protein